MLITTCSHCHARFRVTPQQLNAKQGQVRCGRCRQVFNGFEALERFPDDDTGARLLAAREAQERAAHEVIGGVETLRDERVADDAQAPAELPAPAPAVAAPPPVTPQPQPEPTPQMPVEEPEPPARPRRSARERRRELDLDLTLEPPPRKRPSRAWAFAAVLMALVLAIELAFAFRSDIARRYPVTRPVIEAACGWIACKVPYAREEALLKLEESEMLQVPGRPHEISLGARIRNLASFAQEYPHVELTLTDLSGQAAVRRVLRPADYMGRTLRPGEVVPAGVEFAIQLRLEAPRINATGYQLLLFYP